MFDIEKEETISKTFRIPKKLLNELEKLADEKNISLSKVVIKCCEYALENIVKKETPQEGSFNKANP